MSPRSHLQSWTPIFLSLIVKKVREKNPIPKYHGALNYYTCVSFLLKYHSEASYLHFTSDSLDYADLVCTPMRVFVGTEDATSFQIVEISSCVLRHDDS